jgi:hypothetical protein
MQQFLYILFQLDEARRYIQDGRLEQLRLALLLLDNAAELQMDRRIQGDMQSEDFRERLRNQLLVFPKSDLPADLREIAEWEPLPNSRKSKIERYFDEKVLFLSGRQPVLDPALAAVLKHLHRYRNEAYHKARVRKQTIRTAALILLEINCHLILSVSRGTTSYSSDDDYSWMTERFGIERRDFLFLDELKLRRIVDAIRVDVLPDDKSVAMTLAEHLGERFEELYSALDFIVESLTEVPDRGAALKESQYRAEVERGRLDRQQCPLGNFIPQYTLESLERIRVQLPDVRSAPNRLESFHAFALLERELEPIEIDVRQFVVHVEASIQFAIDIARGK